MIEDFVSMNQEIGLDWIGLDSSRGFSIPDSRVCNNLVKIQEFGLIQDLGSAGGRGGLVQSFWNPIKSRTLD